MAGINFDYNGTHYCLEYSREAIKRMEQAGFRPVESGFTPLIELDMLWAGAFYKNHRGTSSRVIEELLTKMKDKEALLDALRRMVAEAYDTLMDNEGNVEWTANP